MKTSTLVSLLAITIPAGSPHPLQSGALIDSYKAAQCIPVQRDTSASPTHPPRVWEDTLNLSDGISFHISAVEVPGRSVFLTFEPDGRVKIALKTGDDEILSDIRFAPSSEMLYVRTESVSLLGGEHTSLLEYNLHKRRESARARVDPAVLSPECPAQ
jgi:hypothetical protein